MAPTPKQQPSGEDDPKVIEARIASLTSQISSTTNPEARDLLMSKRDEWNAKWKAHNDRSKSISKERKPPKPSASPKAPGNPPPLKRAPIPPRPDHTPPKLSPTPPISRAPGLSSPQKSMAPGGGRFEAFVQRMATKGKR